MPPRLSPLDASFLYLEQPTTPMHVGAVSIFERPPSGFDYDTLVGLIEQRIALVPRYRQKVRHVPANLARPVWVDDVDFDVAYHVRRSALPKPGSDDQLTELVARLMSRPLDPTRPLWEMYLVEGLERGRSAILTKTHQAMVDGISAIDIGQVILDISTPEEDAAAPNGRGGARGPGTHPELWMPRPEPTDVDLVLGAVAEAVARPGLVVENVVAAAGDAVATVGKVAGGFAQLFSMARAASRRAPGTPLNVDISTQRRFAIARTELEDYRRVRAAHGCTVNDVVLSVVAGALRDWLLSRGEPVTSGSSVRAMVPLSVRGEADVPSTATAGSLGNRVSSFIVDLPVGEPSPVVRLHHVTHAMREHTASAHSVGADTLVRIGGFAPPTLHALGARAASGMSKRIFNLVVTNVPGPQFPLYAAGARMLEMFPVVPLAKGQALAIGLTSYDGGVYYGFNGDRDAMPDVEVLAGLVDEALDELVGTVT
ncbi:WS/DGAT/MGAT family O-acyltransferase [Pseudonocardia abyssalis]|uniref:Diacylglycerol O-acyltransferase n=1 Tax=Pseudonocardia abyssalis TaxID=2792008 RepID=A0ABS6UUN8_9PSEU|nr:wax ester/triacylglycerol synthase family O-acyltransferase [Pseudonocardia abyssalis]MBW0118869.1 wax ester/triacylglycerol synthase family O-acyltransferase [Pseudonocardia abyssalis]MBW0135976.1 wax ester/triacylglycerol synthase family O-acyltransferase [Pseudonocardia abyssalis]